MACLRGSRGWGGCFALLLRRSLGAGAPSGNHLVMKASIVPGVYDHSREKWYPMKLMGISRSHYPHSSAEGGQDLPACLGPAGVRGALEGEGIPELSVFVLLGLNGLHRNFDSLGSLLVCLDIALGDPDQIISSGEGIEALLWNL
jgi:hypothetical protein